MLVEQCQTLRFVQAQRMIDYWKLRVDAAGCEDDATRQADRAHFHASPTLDGTVRVDGLLDAIGGSIFRTELDRLERQQYLADEAAGVVRTATQRRAAAVVDMAVRSASAPADAERPRPLITVLVGDDRFASLCELATGTVVTPGQVLPDLGSADLETILFGDDLTVLGASSQRTFTGRLRRAIAARDRHCQHPSGCDVPAPDCDIDHITPYVDGGRTSQWDGRVECRPHNRDASKHDHGAAPRPERPIEHLELLQGPAPLALPPRPRARRGRRSPDALRGGRLNAGCGPRRSGASPTSARTAGRRSDLGRRAARRGHGLRRRDRPMRRRAARGTPSPRCRRRRGATRRTT